MTIRDVQTFWFVIKWHDKWDVFDVEVMMLAKNIDESFTHITINAALNRIVNWRDTMLNLKEYVEEPL